MLLPEKIMWTDDLSIGNDNIDEDHHRLINIYNDLIDLVKFKKGNKEFARVLTEMTDYSLKHFKKEEKYFISFNYPNVVDHKNQHKEYIYKVAMYNIHMLDANPPDPNEIIDFLGNWWTKHIKVTDFEYEQFRIQNGFTSSYEKTF